MSEGPGIALERVRRVTNWRILLLGALAILGLGVLVALIVLQQRTDAARDEAIARQQHTFEVVIRTNQLAGAISAAEAALGRYVVSADKTLGRQYDDQWLRASEHLHRLRQLTHDNPDQLKRIVQLQRAFDVRGKELGETASYSTFQRHNDAWGAYYKVRQSQARQQVERLLDRVVEAERVLLRERTKEAGELVSNSSLASRVLIVFGVSIVIGAVVLGWLAIRAEGERAAADAEIYAERERSAELEAAIAAATERLRAEAKEREEAQAQLRQVQKMEAVGQLTGGIAHDFNNMLAVVVGGLELAKRDLQSGGTQIARHIDNAMEGADRAAALTRRLLAFARAEPLLPEAVQAATLIEGMSDLLDRTLGDAIRVETRDFGKGWRIWVDRHQLENALLNLAVNARDAMEGRGTLTFRTAAVKLADGEVGECRAGDYVAIGVKDSGCGMTPEVLDRVFEPFFTTKPVGKGTGLGLSQIFGFVRQSGGEIGIATRPNRGTTVTLYLPRHLGETVQQSAPAEMAQPTFADSKAFDILVVEDDARVRASTMEALRELGHRVQGCDDPLKAQEAVAGMPSLDLILSDVLMPGQTGPEMIVGLGDKIAGVAVLFVTGYAGEVDADVFGGHPVLRKPFTMMGLSRAVSEAVEQASRRSPLAAAE